MLTRQYSTNLFSPEFLLVLKHIEDTRPTAPRSITGCKNIAADICAFTQKDFFLITESDAESYKKYLQEQRGLAESTLQSYGKVLCFLQHQCQLYFDDKITIVPYTNIFSPPSVLNHPENAIAIDSKFGLLSVKERYHAAGKKTTWKCQCKCGAYTFATTYQLTHGLKTDCGNRKLHALDKRHDLSGQTIGCFYVIQKSTTKINNRLAYDCRCLKCGRIRPIRATQIDKMNSCGCERYSSTL